MIVEKLAAMLIDAAEIIAAQAEVLEMYGIESQEIFSKRDDLIKQVNEYVGGMA